MIANRWYSIAQTTVFDTSCGINITFGESSSVLFTASVKYGVSSLNISSCFIEDDYNISIRLRETESKWCVDLLSNTDIEPIITITDSPYWEADNSAAGSGAIIAVIENISKDFNTTGGGGQGGGESLFEMVNVGTDAVPVYAVVPKNFNGNTVHIFSRGGVSAGGFSGTDNEGNPTGSLGGLSNVDPTADGNFYTDTVLVKRANSATWGVVDLSSIVGLDEEALKRYLTNNLYVTQTDLEPYDERLKTLEALGFKLQKHEVDGVTKYYVESAYDFYSKGGVSSGGVGGQGGGGGTGGGSTVSYIPTVTSGEPLGTLIIDGTPNEIYSPSLADYAKSKDVASTYATKAALNNYATTTALSAATDNITILQGYFNSGIAKEAAKVSNALTFEEGAFSVGSYNGSTAETIKVPTTTSHISEGDNLYYTNARVLKAVADSLGLSTKTENGKTYLRSAYDFFSEGGVSSGGIGTSGGGTGGVTALSALSDVALGILSDGQALVWDATQLKWVNKNISGGTADSIAWDAITGKPSLVYYDTHIDTNTLANSVNKIGYGYATEGWAESGPAISFGVTDYQFQMQMSLAADASFVRWRPIQTANRFSWRRFIDTYNYSSYCLPISGGTMTGSVTFPTNTYNYIGQLALIVMPSAPSTLQLRTTSSDIMSAISFHKSTAWYGTLTADTDSNLRWNDNIVIHSGNIGSYNAGSATKLKEAKSIFGSSFDGTADIGHYFAIKRYSDNNNAFYIENISGGNGYKISAVGGDSYIAFETLKSGSSVTEAMRITREQNVLIGATTDNGKKLQVEGTITSSNWYYSYNDTGWYSVKYAGGIYMKDDVYVTVYNSKCLQIQSNVANRDAALRVERTDTGYSCFFGIGSGGVNRGIWDDNYNKWLINASNDGYTYLTNNTKINQDTFTNGLIINRTVAGSGAAITVQTQNTTIGSFGIAGSRTFEFATIYSGTATVKMSCDANGNFYATGGVSSGSDSRYKTRIKDVSVDIETIAKAPLFVYKWADREDDKLHLGTTAQYWYDTDFKNAVVPTNNEKLWTMSYSEIAMGNTIVLAREQLKVKSRVEVLEDRVKELETELNKYRRA